MKVLVTGGAGFIASNISDALIKEGHDVVIVDNLSNGLKENINKKAKFYKVDITDYKELSKVFKKEKPELVNHHAAQIHVRKSLEDPFFDAHVNIGGMVNVLKCMELCNSKKIVFSSSGGAIYGNPEQLPCKETHPLRPLSPYGIAKKASEDYIRWFCELNNKDYTILRYANVFGPRQNPKGEAGVISIFAGNMMAKKDCRIFGDGAQTRDYVYVGDVVHANLIALQRKTKSKIFNIGMGRETSVLEVFSELSKATNYDKKPIHEPGVAGEVQRITLDNLLAKKELGWSPKVSLKEGMSKVVAWLKTGKVVL